MKRALAMTLFVLAFPKDGYGEENLKKLVLTDCKRASAEASKLTEAELPEFLNYLERVLSLEGVVSNESFGTFDPSGKSMGLGGEHFLRSTPPTRELDAKLCALQLAGQMPNRALPLLPGLFRLETDTFFPSEKRVVLRETVRSIRQSAKGDRASVITTIGETLKPEGSFLFTSLLVDFAPDSRPWIEQALISRTPLLQQTAEEALRALDPRGGEAAKTFLKLLPANPKFANRWLSHLKSYGVISGAALHFALSASVLQSNPKLFQEFLEKAGAEAISELFRPESEELLRQYFTSAPVDMLRSEAQLLCPNGQCDRALLHLLESESSKSRVLAILSQGESFESKLWQVAEEISKRDPSLANSALEALGAFPAKRKEATEYALAQMRELEKPLKKGTARGERAETLRSVARLIKRLSPLPGKVLKPHLAEEFFGIESHADEPYLAAEAISVFRPANPPILLAALNSKAESIRRQGLQAVSLLRPRDPAILRRLLEEASSETDGAPALDVLRGVAQENLPELEKALNFSKLSVTAARVILEIRPEHRGALASVQQALPRLRCEQRLGFNQVIEGHQTKHRKLFVECLPHASHDQRLSLLEKLAPFSGEEWIEITAKLPRDEQSLLALARAGLPSPILEEELKKMVASGSFEAVANVLAARPEGTFLPIAQSLPEESIQGDAIRLRYHLLSEEEFLKHLQEQDSSRGSEALIPEEVRNRIVGLILQSTTWHSSFLGYICRSQTSAQSLAQFIDSSEETTLPSLVRALACSAPTSDEAVRAMEKLSLFSSILELGKGEGTPGLMTLIGIARERSSSRFEKSLLNRLLKSAP